MRVFSSIGSLVSGNWFYVALMLGHCVRRRPSIRIMSRFGCQFWRCHVIMRRRCYRDVGTAKSVTCNVGPTLDWISVPWCSILDHFDDTAYNYHYEKWVLPSRQMTLNQCWFNVGSTSTTLVQLKPFNHRGRIYTAIHNFMLVKIQIE